MARTFLKRYAPAGPSSPQLEAAGLRWLAQAQPSGGVKVAEVISIGHNFLELERLPMSAPTPGAGAAFGRALALTHAAGAPYFGAPPPPWSGPGSIGQAALPLLTPDDAPPTWGQFYARYRLAPYVKTAVSLGAMPDVAISVFGALSERLISGQFDAPQPALVDDVARIHGDLWAGNVMWSPPPWPEDGSDPSWTGATVIDPAAHGGHAETDLAMLALFGIAQFDQIRAGYESVSKLAADWPERVGLHQLHPLLVHAVLFGPSYGQRALERAERYLA